MHERAKLSATENVPEHLRLFSQQSGKILKQVEDFRRTELQRLLERIETVVMNHPIIADNRYLRRFSQGVTVSQARHEIQQFSVFAIHFDIAAAKLVANAPTIEAYEERLNILLNEKGIPFKNGFDGELTGKWSQKTVHFTWLQNMASGLDLSFEEIGKIWIASPGTAQFIDTVMDTFADIDPSTAAGASFAIENWAANALWAPWIEGMQKLNETVDPKINLGYLTYHLAEEAHHSQSTLDELLGSFAESWFDEEKFLRGATTVLQNGVLVYYEAQLASLPGRQGGDWPDTVC